MKLKRCFKTVLSSVLAAAMLITAVPSNLTLDVQAAPTEETVVETVVDTEESTVAAEDVAATVEATTEAAEETTTEAVVEEKEEETVKDEDAADLAAYDISSGYWGPTIGDDGAVTIYYYPTNFTEEVTSVQVKGGWVSDWSDKIEMELQDDGSYAYTLLLEKAPVTLSFEYGFQPNSADDKWDVDDCNPTAGGANSKIVRNPQIDADSNVSLYYYPEHGEYPTSVKVKYKTSDAESYTEADMALDSTYTQIYSVKLSGLEDGTYEYVFDVDGTEVADTNNAAGKGEFSVVSYPAADPNVKSPVVNGKEVTFNYYGPTVSSVALAGSMNGWSSTATPMTYNEDTAYWSTTQTLAAGSYSYKFVVDNNWYTDSLNTSYDAEGNSKVVVTGLENSAVNVKRGGSVALPATLKCYDSEGATTDAAVTYALADADVAWASEVSLSVVEGVTTLATTDALPAEVTTFDLTATDTAGNTSTVAVTVVDTVYNYTIYYYDSTHATGEEGAMTTDDAAFWIWEDGSDGVLYDCTGTEVLSDGRTWVKAEVALSYTGLNIIPKNAGADWAWQDKTRVYSNEAEAENVTLYIVYGDSTVYTEIPEVKEIEKRYLVVEYERTTSTPENWYFYTWNSGYGSNVFVPFEETDGKWIAVVPVMPGLESISYCIERATVDNDTVNHWAEKDGNDYNCAVPADQSVVKIQMEEGQGITHTYPYNKGYEIDVENGMIHFYYRNDDAFLAGSEGGFASVQIELDGTAYDMTWNADEQRYTYDMLNLAPNTYKYRYLLKETAESEAEAVLDRFNEETVTENDIEYSVCTYDLFDVVVNAEMFNESMDYNDNNVLSIKFEGKDGADIAGMKAASAVADLSELGGSTAAEVDTALLELSVAVKEGVAAGTKTIPVTVIDQYGNKYTASTTVEVVNRDKGSDFDWDEAVVYFTVTDRFFDGNKKNNKDGYDVSENGTSSYHGGDFAGLTKKLDYLQDLGVNTIWITPIVENEMEEGLTTEVPGILSWGYHGYWASDFTKLDSHLGTEKEFKALLDAAHKRGMKIMVDVVLNHSGYDQEDYFNSLLKDVSGNTIPMIRTEDEMISGDDQKSSLSGLPDFLTENEEVRNLLVEWQSNWISKYDIDYYRVDTVKHVDDTTWSAFKNALTKIDPDFKMIGEWAGAGYGTDTGMLNEGRMDSLLDFDFNGEATEFVKGDIEGTESFMNARNAAIDNTATLGAFIGSHDEPGFAYSLMNPESGEAFSAEKAEALTKVAASLQITAKGQVVIYYGEEIGMTGANNYPYQDNRYDFDWTLVNDNNDTLTHYKKMLDIREEYSEVFAKGARNTIAASNAGGYDVFSKSYGGTTVYTALNIGDAPVEYTLTGLTAGAFMTDIYGEKLYQADETGAITITIPAAADGGTAVIVERDAEDTFYVQCVDTKTYTGKKVTLTTETIPATEDTEAVEAELKVFWGNKELAAGTDYKVAYKNNTKVGTATVTVTGKGNYAGKEKVTFDIVAKDVAAADVTVNYQDNIIATGKNLKPLTSVVYNGKKLTTKEYGVEYFAVTVSGNEIAKTAVKNVKEAGDYEMVITGKGNFTGTKTVEFTVHAKENKYYMKNLTILLDGKKTVNIPYDGTAKEPVVTVQLKDANKTTVSGNGVCYSVKYDNNVNVGKATVTITGNPAAGFFGSVTKTFKIVATNTNTLSKVAAIDTTNWQPNVPFDVSEGEGIQPLDVSGNNLVTLKAKKADSGLTFTEGVDYKVSYLKNDKAGKATMVFTGINAYTGTIKKTFKIDKVSVSSNNITVTGDSISGNAIYAKKGAKVNVTVEVDGVTLVEGKDYKLKYANNKAVTTDKTTKMPTVTITGIGSFKGSVKETFKIDVADLGATTVTAADAVYQNKKGKYEVNPVVTDAQGTKLVKNKDYTCSYYLVTTSGNTLLDKKKDIVEAGSTVKVVIEPKSANYVGSNEATYEVQTYSITKAKVKVDAQVYTGSEITITKDDISSIKVGKTSLVYGEDYVIVEDSYKNNVDKGTASVTLEGLGNYGGTKTVTFKITSRTVAWWWNLLH